LSFLWKPSRDDKPVGIHLALYDADDLRGAVRADARGRLPRANLQTLKALLDENGATSSTN
jgi:hypothetical protein